MGGSREAAGSGPPAEDTAQAWGTDVEMHLLQDGCPPGSSLPAPQLQGGSRGSSGGLP